MQVLSNSSLGKLIYNFLIISINLSHLFILLFICSVKLSCLSNISPGCFWDWQALTSVWLKVKGRELLLSAFLEKITSCSCFFGSELNCIFTWKVQSLTFCKSEFSSSCEVSLLRAWEKKDVPSAKILQVNRMLSGKSFMYIKDISGQSTDGWGTPDLTSSLAQVWQSGTTLW